MGAYVWGHMYGEHGNAGRSRQPADAQAERALSPMVWPRAKATLLRRRSFAGAAHGRKLSIFMRL